MLSAYKNMPSSWLLDEIIKEANTVEFPSESNLLYELRSELLSRLEPAQPAQDGDELEEILSQLDPYVASYVRESAQGEAECPIHGHEYNGICGLCVSVARR